MSINLSSATDAVQSNTSTANGVLTAKKAKDQKEIEGKMAMDLIQSANINTQTPVGSSGHNINIKA